MVKFTAPPTCVSCFKQLLLQFLTPFATNKFPIILVKFLRILRAKTRLETLFRALIRQNFKI